MATPKRHGSRMFKGVRYELYEYDFPTRERAVEYLKKYKFDPKRIKIVMRYRSKSLPVYDIYYHEKEGQ